MSLLRELSPDIKDYVLYGPNKAQRDVLGMPDFEGVIAQLEKKWKRTTSEAVKKRHARVAAHHRLPGLRRHASPSRS